MVGNRLKLAIFMRKSFTIFCTFEYIFKQIFTYRVVVNVDVETLI